MELCGVYDKDRRTMIFQWFNAREAEAMASDMADHFLQRASAATEPSRRAPPPQDGATALQNLLRRADTDGRLASLNFFKKAKFANSFKWRLLENGVEPRTADHVTHALLMHLSRGASTLNQPGPTEAEHPLLSEKTRELARRAKKAFDGGAYDVALGINLELVQRDPANVEALNNLGATLCKVGEYLEGEQRFRQALTLDPNHAEANLNLGNVLRWLGILEESEIYLRRALKLRPNYTEARTGLGFTLTLLGRLRDAKPRFEKTLKTAPRDADALLGLGLIAKMEGNFSEAEVLFKRILEYKPKTANALAALATLRKMTPADGDWLRAAQELLAEGLDVLHEADLRYSIGKYYDDIGEFDDAFRSFEAANTLLKSVVAKYDREARDGLIDDMLHTYSKDVIEAAGRAAPDSDGPVFVLGMPRSGTSLAEQILASHPSIFGAGEMDFWNALMRTRESVLRKEPLAAAARDKVAEDYLKLLDARAGDRVRVIDKTPVNSDYIGLIYSVFPNARFIYMERDPIDVCLSCYFQQFLAGMNFSMDLSDLAHYYKGHRRLFNHWQSVLPERSLLVVPYAELVQDQRAWTGKMLDFIGLDWSDRCLSFHETERAVITASTWQVRQKIYTHSIGRSREYKKFLGPLKALRN
jgi:tetratricopeptide (TPR) repeat protein